MTLLENEAASLREGGAASDDEGSGRRVGSERDRAVCCARRIRRVVPRCDCDGRSAGRHDVLGRSRGQAWHHCCTWRLAVVLLREQALVPAVVKNHRLGESLRCHVVRLGFGTDAVELTQPLRLRDAGAAHGHVLLPVTADRLVVQLVAREVRARLSAVAGHAHDEAGRRRRGARGRRGGGRRRGGVTRRCDEHRRRKRRRSGVCRGRCRCVLNLGRRVAVASVCSLLLHSWLPLVVCRIRAW